MTDPAAQKIIEPDELTLFLESPDELTRFAPTEATEFLAPAPTEPATRALLERQLAGLISSIRAEARRVGLDEVAALELLGTARTVLERYIGTTEHPAPSSEDVEPEDPPEKAPAKEARDGSIAAGSLILNTFVVRTLLARGGMGEIYRVRHRDLKTDHAVKVIVPEFRDDAKVVGLFQQEGRLLARIRHDAVVDCAGLFRDTDGRSMILLEYLDGPSLSHVMRRGPLGLTSLEALVRRLAAGLGAIHAAGVVHRDISPDNILLPGNNPAAAKIVDFGVASALQGGGTSHDGLDFSGKYSFASPEQLGMFGGAVGIASDIYSFGLLIAAAARGEKLPMGQSMAEAVAARHRVPPLDAVPDRLRPLVERMLRPEPRHRPTDLAMLLRPLADPPSAAAPRHELRHWLDRHLRSARRFLAPFH
ncbi:serine/threonine-protein kinase [Telmatospirillum sp.]|uniref:serine/threonine-protein kinase n=1 Tax=Telmatospirillum sp. TaxID=2079197 RepID=UPI002845770A|nr:serine/threonine-protein kinase [Telmatospirillum sp.]MDR3435260.1 serine/threonine-protein kinase [Telmatospirillum sp.]